MDRKKEVETLYHANLSAYEKYQQLKDLLLDCYNEMEAQDQNMHPEVQHNLSEAYQLAKNYLRKLEEESKDLKHNSKAC